ncbi:MAG: NADH-quinone oxidoreductase subunit L [Armatimonadota bacterium]
MADLIWLVPIFPLIGAIINGLLLSRAPERLRKPWSGVLAALASVAAFVVAVVIWLNLGAILNGRPWIDSSFIRWIEFGLVSLPIQFRIDPLSVTMMLVVTGVGSLIHIFSISYMIDDVRFTRFFTYLNLFMFSMLLLVLANNYILLFVGWEGVGLCSFLLIGFFFERDSAAQAGKKAFIINRVGDFGFILAALALFWLTEPHTLVFNTVRQTGVLDQAAHLDSLQLFGIPALTVICLLMFLGCTGKSAQLPLYLWLPDAMEGPTPVSALIHAATMVTAGVYLIARSAPLFSLSPEVQMVVATVGIITAFYAALVAIKQYDIKRVLAYSTVSQLGFMFVGVGVGAYAAGISHLVTHAFFKALMFLGAGAVMHALEGQLDMRKMGNMKAHMRVTFGTFALGWLAIAGIPPFSGFVSKDAILEHAYPVAPWIFWLGAIVAGMTAFYMSRMFFTVFFGSERIEMGEEGHGGDAQEHGRSHAPGHEGHGHPRHVGEPMHAHEAHGTHGHTHDHGHGHTHDHAHGHGHAHHGHAHVHPEQPLMNWPLIVLAILSAAGGWIVLPILNGWLDPVTVGMVPHAEGAEPHHSSWSWSHTFGLWQTWVSIAAALIGIGLAAAMRRQFELGWSPGVERALGALMAAYEGTLHFLFVRVGTWISEFIYRWIDRAVIDGLVNFSGSAVDYLAESLRTLQTGYVRNYALVMLAGAVFVVACFMVILQGYSMRILLTAAGAIFVVTFVLMILQGMLQRRAEVRAGVAPDPHGTSGD